MESRTVVALACLSSLLVFGCDSGGGGGDPPAAPMGLSAAVNGSNIDLDWTASPGATSYNVYYGIEPGVTRSAATLIGNVMSDGATLTAQPSATAYFIVTAIDGDGESAPSNEVMAAVPSSGSDPLFIHQWHLVNSGQLGGTPNEDAHVAPVWTMGFDGAGVRIAIVDDGLEIGHEDLLWNCLPGKSINYVAGGTDPTGGEHGTSCAGVAASVGGNSLGGRGAAYEAHLVGYNFLAHPTTSTEANAMTRDAAANWVSSNSWGPLDGVPMPSSSSWKSAVAAGLAQGRGGKGLLYVFAAGNGALAGADPGDNSNLDGYANYYGVIAVGAVGDDGVKASYSENGANVFVCAPSMGRANHAITTVDRTGSEGYNNGAHIGDYPDDQYTNTFNGTSSACPLAAGVVALVLQANPNLTWRDVRYVLAESARINDAGGGGWTINGGGHWVNHKYGFGVVDAAAAVVLASSWTNVAPLITFTASPAAQPNLPIPDDDPLGVSSTITVAGSGISNIEHVEIFFDADDHPYSGDLEIELTSPSGSNSLLSEAHMIPMGISHLRFDNFRFGSVRHLDEPADGMWTLTVRDLNAADTGTFKSWSLTFRGH